MAEAMAARYWCHRCSQIVIPVFEAEIKCPICESGFVEEVSSSSIRETNDHPESDFGSERALSLWAPIFLGMMNNPRHRRRRVRQLPVDADDRVSDHDDDDYGIDGRNAAWTSELTTELESTIRRRRSSASILQMLHGMLDGMTSRLENIESELNTGIEGDAVRNEAQAGSLGDYFVGPGMDLLLQHLAENDPNRYGTPPALKEAVAAMPSVIIKEDLKCCVCLDDFERGTEVKEMPCKHKFHSGCIMPWLDLHSSCPVCRYQLPAEEIKHGGQRESESESYRANSQRRSGEEESNGNVRVSPGRRFSFPWSFTGLFSSSGSQSSSGNGSRAASGSQSDDN